MCKLNKTLLIEVSQNCFEENEDQKLFTRNTHNSKKRIEVTRTTLNYVLY